MLARPEGHDPPLPVWLGHTPSWTSGDVLLWVKRAFATNPRTRRAAEIRPLNWPNDDLSLADPMAWALERNVLLGWARCRAQKESFAELCVGRGWKASTAYLIRDRAAQEIADGIKATIVKASFAER